MNKTDLLPEDVYFEEFTAQDGGKGVRAILGFIVYQGIVKMYSATGATKEIAKRELSTIMQAHLIRAMS